MQKQMRIRRGYIRQNVIMRIMDVWINSVFWIMITVGLVRAVIKMRGSSRV